METGKIAYDSVEDQVTQVLKNLAAIAQQGGSSLDRAVKVTVYLTDLNDLTNEQHLRQLFKENPPARVCVEVGALPKGVSVEMDAICVCD